uniref:Neur_chan_LBD domain-containing protein n=1 Tax=Angiostrongylus cantonensis TaxID=6313 RepID=A0A0K0CWC3_ANGCA
LEDTLMKSYNSRHRPVKKESTTVQVSVFMSISHVEKVDEHEQTMLVHGHLWATWFDEYLVWEPNDYNGTSKINVDPWRIWQPALALYNSARGNSWHLYMHGLPAIVSNSGRVWATGSFSFHVTCRFDFSDWPYDEQECPIVVADWVYDLSRVNLSDPQGNTQWNKPTIRLNYDPIRQDEKKHVAEQGTTINKRSLGWEVKDTWRRHCYWGPSGCKDELPEGQPEWYWSLLEFGVKLKRHTPYFGVTVIMPTIITCLLTLFSFWIDAPSMSIALVIFNVLLQGLFGWDLIRELPPGSGSIPKIGKYEAFWKFCHLNTNCDRQRKKFFLLFYIERK